MTARHVVDPSDGPKPCNVKVRIRGRWIRVQTWHWWYNRRPADGRLVDLAVLKLAQRVDAHLFNIRPAKARLGTNLAMVGHPLGNGVSVTQGRLIARNRYQGVPLILVNLLGAEGASGSAFLDNDGNVVGVLQMGLGGRDAFGQRTSGAVVGIDLNAWWGNGKRNLCRAYPDGGIPMCATKKPTPTSPAPEPTPAPPATPPTTSDTATDPSGDSGTAPDITSLTVERDAEWISFKIRLASPISSTNQRIVLHLDSTGDFKDDYTWYGWASKYDFVLTRDGQSVSVNPSWLQTHSGGSEFEVRLELAGIQNPPFVNVLVITQAWVTAGGQPVVVDYDEAPAEENGHETWWKFTPN